MSNPVEPVAKARRLPWLWLILGIVSAALLVSGVTIVYLVARGWDGRPAKGDALIAVHAVGTDGRPPSAVALDQARQVLLSRMVAAGLTRPTVAPLGTDGLVITVAKPDADRAKALLSPGDLEFRKVLDSQPDRPAASTACPGARGDYPDRAAALAAAKAKLGPAWDRASQYSGTTQVDPSGLEVFSALDCTEVAALPASMQYFVPTVTCAMLNARTGGPDPAADAVVACDQQASTKYVLDVAKVHGNDVADAVAGDSPQQGGWQVRLHFSAAGQANWTALTRDAVDSGKNPSAAQGNGQVAILLDSRVLTAPQILDVITGDAVISGGIDERHAKLIAATVRYGALPVSFTIVSIAVVP